MHEVESNEHGVCLDDKKEIDTVLDEELNNCIQKLRNAVFGYEIRTYITEYEELMLKKTDMITQKFIMDNKAIQRTTNENREKHERNMKCLFVLQIIQGIALVLLGMSAIVQ